MAKTVFLDAGHGGKDSGALGLNLKEKDVNLSVTKKIGTFLTNNGIVVRYTRDKDVYLTLSERSSMANKLGADCFLSVHCNAYNGVAKGIETYCYKTTTRDLANYIHKEVIKDTTLYSNNRGVKTGNFHVIRETKMRAALIELGFIDSETDVEILRKESNHIKFAKLIAKGICNYLGVEFKEEANENPEDTSKPPITDKTTDYIVSVKSNILKDSSSDSEIIKVVNPGEIVKVVSFVGDFAKIVLNGIEYAYISNKSIVEVSSSEEFPYKNWTVITPSSVNNKHKFTGKALQAGIYNLYVKVKNANGETQVPVKVTVTKTVKPLVITNKYIGKSFDTYINSQEGKLHTMSNGSSMVTAPMDKVREYASPSKYSVDDPKFRWIYLKLDEYHEVDVTKLNEFLNSKYPTSGKEPVFHNRGEEFIDASIKYSLDALYFVAHACLETGWGGSTLCQGVEVIVDENENAVLDTNGLVKLKTDSTPTDTPTKTVYNLFGIGAVDGNSIQGGADKAFKEGWFDIGLAIDGGAKWISTNYIHSTKYPHQNTLYSMKWDYVNYWHQYSTDIEWHSKQSSMIANMNHCRVNGDNDLTLIYPVYS